MGRLTTTDTGRASRYNAAVTRRIILLFVLAVLPACAQTLQWSERTWKITDGHIAGVVPARPANVSVAADGSLHMRLVKSGDSYTGAEVFTTEDLGYGTYQWVIEGANIYAMDPTVVLGLFAYGPAHGKGASAENEIDIEFSAWNHTTPEPVNADFTVYPPTVKRRSDGHSAWEDNFYVSTHPQVTTARFVWTAKHIDFYIMEGAVPLAAGPRDVLKHDVFESADDIPQVTMPIGINLWSFRQPPGHEWEIVLRRFEYSPEGK